MFDGSDDMMFWGGEDSCSSHGSSLPFSFSYIKAKIHRALSEEEIHISKEERRNELRKALALRQRGDQKQNAINISRNDEEFRKLKQDMKNSGMLTHNGVAQVLSPIIDKRITSWSFQKHDVLLTI
jgi:hypothetical protein